MGIKIQFSGEFEVDTDRLTPVYRDGVLVGFHDARDVTPRFITPTHTLTTVNLGVQWTWGNGTTSGPSRADPAEAGITVLSLQLKPDDAP